VTIVRHQNPHERGLRRKTATGFSGDCILDSFARNVHGLQFTVYSEIVYVVNR